MHADSPSQSKPRRDANLAGIAAAARPSAPSVRPSIGETAAAAAVRESSLARSLAPSLARNAKSRSIALRRGRSPDDDGRRKRRRS